MSVSLLKKKESSDKSLDGFEFIHLSGMVRKQTACKLAITGLTASVLSEGLNNGHYFL